VQCQGDGKMWCVQASSRSPGREIYRRVKAKEKLRGSTWLSPVRERGNAAARMEGSRAIFSAAPHVVSSVLWRKKCVGSRYTQWDSIGVILMAEYFPLKA